MSLKSILINECKNTGYLSLDRITEICKGDNTDERYYKVSHAERVLRPSSSGSEIAPVFKNNAIIGYEPKNTLQNQTKNNKLDPKLLNHYIGSLMQKYQWSLLNKDFTMMNSAIKSKYIETKCNCIKLIKEKFDI